MTGYVILTDKSVITPAYNCRYKCYRKPFDTLSHPKTGSMKPGYVFCFRFLLLAIIVGFISCIVCVIWISILDGNSCVLTSTCIICSRNTENFNMILSFFLVHVTGVTLGISKYGCNFISFPNNAIFFRTVGSNLMLQ